MPAALVALCLLAVPVAMIGYDWIIRDGLGSAPNRIHLCIRGKRLAVRRWRAVWVLNLSFGLLASLTVWLTSHITPEPIGFLGAVLILVVTATSLIILENNFAFERKWMK